MARIPPLTSLGKEQAVTAVAALPSHLALGTTSGVVFWHDRAANSLQRLEVFPGVEVTCLALASTTDLMLAVGSYEGQLAIYQASLISTGFFHSVLPPEKYFAFGKMSIFVQIFFSHRFRSQSTIWSALDLPFQGLSKTSNILLFQTCTQGSTKDVEILIFSLILSFHMAFHL